MNKLFYTFFLLLINASVFAQSPATRWYQHVQSATYVGASRKVHLFKEGSYIGYHTGDDKMLSQGNTQGGFNLPTLENINFNFNADAAMYVGASRKIHVFKGNQYIGYDTEDDKVVSTGNIAGGFGLPAIGNTNFNYDIDAAVYCGAGRKVYIFKDDKYVGYDTGDDKVVSTGIISQDFNFPMVGTTDFSFGIDAATYAGTGRKIYLFKENKYISYDAGTDKVISTGTIASGFNFPVAGIKPFDAANWMTDSYEYIKNMKLNEVLMTGSHNALYNKYGYGYFCYVQRNFIDEQFSYGGARYFDIRPYVKKQSSSQYTFGGFHGDFCSASSYDLRAKLASLKAKMEGKKEIIILHIKQVKFSSGSDTELNAAFMNMLTNVFGNHIITPAEAPLGIYAYTYGQLLAKGNVVIVSEYNHAAPVTFKNPPRANGNKGKFLWYPYIAETNRRKLTEGFEASGLLNTTTNPATPLVVGYSASWGFNLKSEAVLFNQYFYENVIDRWCQANYHWIHSIDYVGWDQGWSRKIADRLYQENIKRAMLSKGNQRTSKHNTARKMVGKNFDVYPNPVISKLINLEFTSDQKTNSQINIYSLDQRNLLSKTVDTNKGFNQIKINLSGMKPGVYIIQLYLNGQQINRRLVIY